MDESSQEVESLVARSAAGDVRALARLLTIAEADQDGARILDLAVSAVSSAHVLGITGPPGAGKSTTTNALIRVLRQQGLRVAVLAIDPSSPVSGGSLLGDRVRMQEHVSDAGVYVRSMASRGQLGGLSAAAPLALRVLDAAGFDVIVVETVGVGQNEVEVATIADTAVVLLSPGMGDAVQAAKAGLLEVADVFVVNKSDREGAQDVRRDLSAMIALERRGPGHWRSAVVMTTATEMLGIDELAAQVQRHRDHLRTTGEGERRGRRRIRTELENLAVDRLVRRLRARTDDLDRLTDEVLRGETDRETAVAVLVTDPYGRQLP